VVGLFGLVVGSFLNVAIYRLPREELSVSKPLRSFCPHCGRTLSWSENLPVISWLAQRGRCRGCGWRIPWRYPAVEVLTAALWVLAAWYTPAYDLPLLAVRLLAVGGLIVATFVDFDCYEIPDEISKGGMWLAPIASFAVPRLHAGTWVALEISGSAEVDRAGALVGSFAGMLVGGGTLYAIGWLGQLAFKRDAMGFGDVKLLAAAGGFVGPGGALAALAIASFAGGIVGAANIARLTLESRRRTRARRSRKPFGRSLQAARIRGRMIPFGPYLALGSGFALLGWQHVRGWL
jgi:leader peptidase (prepilin peptidase)/N-methyltransferase